MQFIKKFQVVLGYPSYSKVKLGLLGFIKTLNFEVNFEAHVADILRPRIVCFSYCLILSASLGEPANRLQNKTWGVARNNYHSFHMFLATVLKTELIHNQKSKIPTLLV